MNLAILTYEFVSNKPEGIPDVWPCEVKPLGESTELPGEDWVLMTEEDYSTYLDTHRSTYEAWEELQTLDFKKNQRIAEVDAKTQYLISQGFEFDSTQFSLSLPAQVNWSGMMTLQALLTWPMSITTLDDGEYSLAEEDLVAFIATGKTVITNNLDAGRSLKLQIKAATSLTELDAIVDNR